MPKPSERFTYHATMNQHFRIFFSVLIITCACLLPNRVTQAGGKATAARELLETVCEKFGKKLTRQSTETLTAKLDDSVIRYGDDAAQAFRKIGPGSLPLIEQAGANASDAIRLMARRGDEAVWVVSQPNRLAIFVKHGDDAAEAMIRHREIVEPLLQNLGRSAAKALAKVNSQNARRLVIMADEGDLAKIGRTPELMSVVERFGDRAMGFIWRHKFVLAGGAALAAFLNDPEPFIDGTREITIAGVESIAAPIAQQAAKQIPWPAVSIVMLGFSMLATWRYLPRRAATTTVDPQSPRTKLIKP